MEENKDTRSKSSRTGNNDMSRKKGKNVSHLLSYLTSLTLLWLFFDFCLLIGNSHFLEKFRSLHPSVKSRGMNKLRILPSPFFGWSWSSSRVLLILSHFLLSPTLFSFSLLSSVPFSLLVHFFPVIKPNGTTNSLCPLWLLCDKMSLSWGDEPLSFPSSVLIPFLHSHSLPPFS